MRKSIAKRMKISKNGKISRRPRGLGHSRANKNRKQVMRKKKNRNLNLPINVFNKDILRISTK